MSAPDCVVSSPGRRSCRTAGLGPRRQTPGGVETIPATSISPPDDEQKLFIKLLIQQRQHPQEAELSGASKIKHFGKSNPFQNVSMLGH